jgi:hypothetical protein
MEVQSRMNWVKIWFATFIVELFIWSYVIYLHFEIKRLEKIKVPRPKYQRQVIVKTKKDIVRG